MKQEEGLFDRQRPIIKHAAFAERHLDKCEDIASDVGGHEGRSKMRVKVRVH